MTRDMAGLRAIVTGASSGIGRAVAVALAHSGVRVTAAARSADRLDVLVTELKVAGREVLPVRCDVTVLADRESLVRDAVAAWGGLDLLVNVAGVGSWGHFATSTEAVNRQVLEVNFFAPLELTRIAVPHLTAGRQPAVVNVTSMTGRRGMPAWPEYSASKMALVGMGEALRGEFARFGIEVLTIVPGLTKTNLNNHLLRNDGRVDIPFDRGMEPAAVAAAVVAAVRSNRREVVLGGEAKKILWLNKLVPRLLNRLIARRVTATYAEAAKLASAP